MTTHTLKIGDRVFLRKRGVAYGTVTDIVVQGGCKPHADVQWSTGGEGTYPLDMLKRAR